MFIDIRIRDNPKQYPLDYIEQFICKTLDKKFIHNFKSNIFD